MQVTYFMLLAAMIGLLFPVRLFGADPPEELYRQALDGGQELRVLLIRHVADWSELQPTFTEQLFAERAGELRVLLRTSGGKELILASHPLIEMADPKASNSGAAVMHCRVVPNQVVIVFSAGPFLGACRIGRDHQIIRSDIAWLYRWAVSAVMRQLTPDSVVVRSQQDQQGHWTLEVAERRGGSTPPKSTTFVQEGDRWEFRALGKPPVQ